MKVMKTILVICLVLASALFVAVGCAPDRGEFNSPFEMTGWTNTINFTNR
ncbi:MAG: hypothetical protein AABZ39_12015 [Spirochaetota bacterium]